MSNVPAPSMIELEHALGYTGSVHNSLYLHPNSKDLVYVAGGTVVIGDMTDLHNQVFLTGHDDDVTCLSLSRSGKYVISGQLGANPDALIWDFQDKRLLYRLQEHDYGVAAVGFSHDERVAVSVGFVKDNRIFCWDMSNGYIIAKTLTNFRESITTNSDIQVKFGGFVKDVKRRDTNQYQFATICGDDVRMWEMNPVSGTLQYEKMKSGPHQREYTSLEFSSDNSHLFCGSKSGDVSIFSVKHRNLVAVIPSVCTNGVQSMFILPGTDAVYAGGGDGNVHVLRNQASTIPQGSPFNYTVVQRFKLDAAVVAMHSSLDGCNFVAGTSNSTIFLCDVNSQTAKLVSEAPSAPVTCMEFLPKTTDQVCVCTADGYVCLFDLSHYRILTRAQIPNKAYANAVDFVGPCIVCGCSDGTVQSFDMDTCEPLWNVPRAHANPITALVMSHSGRFFVTGGAQGEIKVWEVRTRQLVIQLKEHSGSVNRLRLFQDDIHLLSAGKDRTMLMWDLKAERRVLSMQVTTGSIFDCDLFHDQQRVASVGQNKQLNFWDLADLLTRTGTNFPPSASINQAHGKEPEPRSIAVSHSDKYIVTGGTDQAVVVWDANQGRQLERVLGHSNTVTCVCFSPDDRQVLSAGLDGVLFVWNLYE